MDSARLLVKALLWRYASSIALLLVATSAVTAAAAGPLYLAAADQSVLQSTLDAAPVYDRGVTLTAQPAVRAEIGQSAVGRLTRAIAAVPDLRRWLLPGIRTVRVGGDLAATESEPTGYAFELVAREGSCQRLAIVRGACASQQGDVAISDRSAAELHVDLGSSVLMRLAGRPVVQPLRVVGIYHPGDFRLPYWWGLDFFNFAPPLPNLFNPQPFYLDSFFTTETTTDSLPPVAFPEVTQEMPLRGRGLRQADLAPLTAALEADGRAMVDGYQVTVDPGLAGLLRQARDQQAAMVGIAGLVDLQLVLLALLVLYAVVVNANEAREHEVALAKLRGLTPLGVASAGLLEPAALLCLALPAGVGAAWLLVTAVAARLLVPGTRAIVDPPTLAAAAAAFAGGLLAIGLGGRQVLVRSLNDQLRRAGRGREATRFGLALEVAAVALAGAGFVDLTLGGAARDAGSDPLGVLAPGLLAIAVAVAAMRLLPMAGWLVSRRTRFSPHLATFLAVRQVARRPTGLRLVLLLSIASGLAVFAVTTWAVADEDRALQAEFQVGAARVLTVRAPAGADLETAVRRADPGGRQAMAVVQYHISSENLLAVDSGRLAAVTAWPAATADRSLPAVARWLSPPLPASVRVSGTDMRLTFDTALSASPAPDLQATVVEPDGQADTADLGSLAPGAHAYTAGLPPACATGCRLTALAPLWPAAAEPSPNATVSALWTGAEARAGSGQPWQPFDAGLATPARWRPSGPGAAIAEAGGGRRALRLTFADDTTAPSIRSADLPPSLPALVTPDVVAINGAGSDTAIVAEGLDSGSLVLDGRAHASALPRLGASGILLDLGLARRAQVAPQGPAGTDEVWLSAGAGPALVGRLRGQGLTIERDESSLAIKRRLDQGGPALAYALFLLAAAAAAVLAVGATVFMLSTVARARAHEVALLRAVGVRPGPVFRALLGEQLLLLISGLACGTVAGLVGAGAALPGLPQTAGQATSVALPLGPLAALAAGLLAALVAAAAAGVAAVIRSASPASLRTAAE